MVDRGPSCADVLRTSPPSYVSVIEHNALPHGMLLRRRIKGTDGYIGHSRLDTLIEKNKLQHWGVVLLTVILVREHRVPPNRSVLT
jgi:hypothetical protein